MTTILICVGSGVAGEKPTLEDLSWMAGSWAGDSGGMQMEEHWLEPKGGLMLGLHRDVSSSGKAFFEYLRIESGPEGIVYLASPSGKPATPFHLVEVGERRAVFANPEHDFPQRILYWIEGEIQYRMHPPPLNARFSPTGLEARCPS